MQEEQNFLVETKFSKFISKILKLKLFRIIFLLMLIYLTFFNPQLLSKDRFGLIGNSDLYTFWGFLPHMYLIFALFIVFLLFRKLSDRSFKKFVFFSIIRDILIVLFFVAIYITIADDTTGSLGLEMIGVIYLLIFIIPALIIFRIVNSKIQLKKTNQIRYNKYTPLILVIIALSLVFIQTIYSNVKAYNACGHYRCQNIYTSSKFLNYLDNYKTEKEKSRQCHDVLTSIWSKSPSCRFANLEGYGEVVITAIEEKKGGLPQMYAEIAIKLDNPLLCAYMEKPYQWDVQRCYNYFMENKLGISYDDTMEQLAGDKNKCIYFTDRNITQQLHKLDHFDDNINAISNILKLVKEDKFIAVSRRTTIDGKEYSYPSEYYCK
jgi:hypothetical protein